MDSYNMITGDSDYRYVKDVWEKKLQDPNFVFQNPDGSEKPTCRSIRKRCENFTRV